MLPITQVIIYKHGVAYYQREGFVNGNSVIELTFKAEQMNDVLKSLTTLDFGKGCFGAVAYDSEESAERRLSELSMQIPKGAAITEFLDQLKGVQASVNTPTAHFEGAILGVEELAYSSNINEATSATTLPHLALLNPETGMNYLLLQNIQSIRFSDENIQRELSSLMETHAGIARNEKKRLSVQAIGEDERKICISYVVEAPAWKTSYRLINLQNDSNQHLLQGWSIVDNTSEEDWQNVHLTLVSGLPISFRHDLYSPRHLPRPEIRVNQNAALAPPVVERGITEKAEAHFDDAFDLLESAAPAPQMSDLPAAASVGLMKARSRNIAASIQDSNPVQTRNESLGDLFSYTIEQPVDIKRGQSALVPILQSSIDSENISYYNENIRRENPMSSFKIINNTELTLEGGPITVYEGENYLGEAMLDTLRKQDEKIVPYSVDLAITVKKNTSIRERDYSKASKSGHYIYKHKQREIITEYQFDSQSEKTSILYLDHPFQHHLPFDSKDKPPELIESTDNYWRYRIELPEKQQTYYKVVEIEYTQEAITIPEISTYEIKSLISHKLIDKSTAKKLEHIAELCEKRSKQQNQLELNNTRYHDISEGQDRLRNNIQVLGGSAEENKLRARYITKLNQEEDTLENTTALIEAIEKDIEKLSTQINSAIDTLTIED